MKIVLQKYIALAGICSRRASEELILRNKVKINGETAKLGDRVGEDDVVEVDGKKIGAEEKKEYIMLNKPRGYICTNKTFKGESSVLELVETDKRLFVVGRLDKNSCGLVILTNDGELTQKLTHPKFGHEKKYIVKIKEFNVSKKGLVLSKFVKGIDIGEGDGVVKAKKIDWLGEDKFEIILTQGKKRQIRRMFEDLDCKVSRLQRVSIGNLELGDLRDGKWRRMSDEELKLLKSNDY